MNCRPAATMLSRQKVGSVLVIVGKPGACPKAARSGPYETGVSNVVEYHSPAAVVD